VLQRAIELRRNGRACEWRRRHSGRRKVERSKVVAAGRELQPGRPWGLDSFPLPTSLLPGGSDLRR
jgi:hypothetical protein